ncbi:MAG: GNAT family N-acetyltransferase [Marinilabiliales bacterium]|nr:GNAT family N-acetyltransferase [Marinilabiliales bacterium]
MGEGTNRATDIDEYDFYYDHLIVWDDEAGSLVGAYRIGKGKGDTETIRDKRVLYQFPVPHQEVV